jgi:hypothetical protein
MHVAWLDHVRYERQADYPDEIVARSRRLLPKRRRPFLQRGGGGEAEEDRPSAPRPQRARGLAVS